MDWRQKGIIIVLVVATTIVIVLFFQGFFSKKNIDPWLLIPENAALVVDVAHPHELYELVSTKNEFWKSLLSVDAVKQLDTVLKKLDSTNAEKFPLIKDLFNSPLLLSIQATADSSTSSFLISIPNNNLHKNENLSLIAGEILNKSFIIGPNSKNGNSIIIKRKGSEDGIFVTIYNRVLLISSDYHLLDNIINKPQENVFHFSNSTQFQKLKSTAGKNVVSHFYINYRSLYVLLSSIMKDKYGNSLEWMKNFASWSVLDLLLKDDELFFSGYTDVDNSKQFLAKYSEDIPVNSNIFSVLPYNTNFILDFGVTNFLNKRNPESLIELSKKTGLNIEAFFKTIDSDICLASSASRESQLVENSWAIIKLKDKKAAADYLAQLEKNSESNSVERYENFIFRKISSDNLISQLLGLPSWNVDRKWYTIYKDYAVFSSSTAALKSYISSVKLEKTLANNDNFISFSKNISESSNITLLVKPYELDGFINNQFLNPESQNNIFISTFLGSLNMLSVQFSSDDPFFYTSISANHIKNFKEEKPYLWKFNLDTKAISDPFLVKDDDSKSVNLLVLDDLFTLYYINSEGELIWKKRLDSQLLGNIQEITNPRTKAKHLLFNTKEYIYLMDLNGEAAQGFPVKLSPLATNGLTYCQTTNPLLVLAQADNIIHAYTLNGKKVRDWKNPKTEDNIEENIAFIESGNNAYFVLTDKNETALLFNKNGSSIKLKKPIEKSTFSTFYKNKTNSKGELLTTNKDGKLTYISGRGKIQYTDFGNFSPEHYFLYEDFNGNGIMDFIYIDGKKLTVFNRFKKVLYSYTFKSEIKRTPVFQRINKKQIMLAIVPEKENSIYVFDNMGKVKTFPNFPENANFALYQTTDNTLSLITSSENSIYFYRLK